MAETLLFGVLPGKVSRLLRDIAFRPGLPGKLRPDLQALHRHRLRASDERHFLPAAVPAWQKLIVVGAFGGTALLLARLALSRKPALRVDAAGVTIRPYPLRFKAIAFYPWEDVDQIVLLPVLDTPAQCVRIKLRDGASLSGGRPARQKSQKALFFAQAEVAVNGWTLRPARLAAAVACFAPGVQVLDGSTGFVANPDELPEPGDHGTD